MQFDNENLSYHIFFPEVAKTAWAVFLKNPYPSAHTIFSVSLFPSRHDGLDRDVFIRPQVLDILHEFSIFEIVRLEQRILPAIEIERVDAVPVTELSVEGGSCFHPLPFQMKFHEAVVGEEVRPQSIDQLFRGEMVPNRCEPHAGGYS